MVREHRLLPDSYINPSLPLHLTATVVALQQALGLRGCPSPGRIRCWRRARSRRSHGAAAVLLLGLAAARSTPGSGGLAALLLAVSPAVVNLGPFATPEPFLLAAMSLVSCSACGTSKAGHPRGPSVRPRPRGLDEVHGRRARPCPCSRPSGCGRATRRRLATAPRGCSRDSRWLAAASSSRGPSGPRSPRTLRLPDLRLLHPESARAFVRGPRTAAFAAGAALLVARGLSPAGHERRPGPRRSSDAS